MILLQVPSGGTYVDYDFYKKFSSMESAVTEAYAQIIQGMGNLGAVASSIAAIAATLYIGFRVLRHIANAEGVDVFPLFRPFVMGFLILNFTLVTDFLDAMMSPVTAVTQNMIDIQTTRIQQLEELRNQKIQERLAQLDKKMDETSYWSAGELSYLLAEKIRIYFDEALDSFLKNLFYAFFLAARLVILTARAFFLIVLTIIGPLTFALAIFNGFQDSHLMWIARYVQISLWFPLANILGSIVTYLQGKVITIHYLEMTNNVPDEAQSGDLIYMVFMVIATLCYFTIPTISGYIISSSGVGGALQRITNLSATTAMAGMPAVGALGAGATAVGGALGRGAGEAGLMGLGLAYNAGAAVAQTAANYGNYYGAAIQQELGMRNITKQNQD